MDTNQANIVIKELQFQSHLFEQALIRFRNCYDSEVSVISKNQNAAKTKIHNTPPNNETSASDGDSHSVQKFVNSEIPTCINSLLSNLTVLHDELRVHLPNHEQSSDVTTSTSFRPLCGHSTTHGSHSRGSPCGINRFPFPRSTENSSSRNLLSSVAEDPCQSCRLVICTPSPSDAESLKQIPNIQMDLVDSVSFPTNSPNSSELSAQSTSLASIDEFIARVGNVLTMTDIDNPGIRTGAPPNPNITSIRRPIDECLPIWRDFFRKRKDVLPAEVRESLRHPTFDNWRWTDADLLCFIRYFFTGDVEEDDALHLTKIFSIPLDVLDAWLCVVYSRYNSVYFHNFKHAFMVTQMIYTLIREADLFALLSSLDLFVLLFSAVCHDLDHPGLNNVYQNNAITHLSICYNTNSPLENHHCSVAFDILGIPETNILIGLSESDVTLSKQLILRCILGTDMAKHSDLVSSFIAKFSSVDNSLVEESSNPLTNRQLSFSELKQLFENDKESHALLLVILLKIADISTEIRPLSVSDRWLKCLLDEFFFQADLELLAGLPVSPSMDRSTVKVADCQCSFLKFGMVPLAEAIVAVFPGLSQLILVPARQQLEYYTVLSQQSDVHKVESSPDLKHVSTSSNDSSIPCSVQEESPKFLLINKNNSSSTISSQNSISSNLIPLCENQQHQAPEFRLPDMRSASLSTASYSKRCQTLFDSTLVSSAGVAEFLPLLSQWPKRPMRRSLGELPWPRTLSSDFVNIVAAKRYLTPRDCFRRSLYITKYLDENPDVSFHPSKNETCSPPSTSTVSNEDVSSISS